MPPDLIYYDAMNMQALSHFSHSTNLSEPGFDGMSQVWETGKAGYVGGYMANIPLNGNRGWVVRR